MKAEHVGSRTFCPIPSTGGKYEINPMGEVRNAKFKRNLKKSPDRKAFALNIGGRKTKRTLASLLWEVFGILPKKSKWRFKTEVTATLEGRVHKFNSFSECASFLAPKLNYSAKYLRWILTRRQETFAGCRFVYPNGLSPQPKKSETPNRRREKERPSGEVDSRSGHVDEVVKMTATR